MIPRLLKIQSSEKRKYWKDWGTPTCMFMCHTTAGVALFRQADPDPVEFFKRRTDACYDKGILFFVLNGF